MVSTGEATPAFGGARGNAAGDRLGSLDKGKIANVVVADGDLFEEKTAIKHVFVNGRPVALPR